MLKKLLKYDFQAVFKYFIPMSIAMLVYSCLATLTFQIGPSGLSNHGPLLSAIAGLATVAFVFMVIAYCIISQALIIVNFFKSMSTDAGYLTHTLPVKKSSIIISKAIMAEAVMLISFLVILLSLVIFLDVPTNLSLYSAELSYAIALIIAEIGAGRFAFIIVSFLVLLILSPLLSCSIFFVSIAFGQLMNRHKVIGSFAAYFVILFVVQILGTVLSYFVGSVAIYSIDDITNRMLPIFITGTILFTIALSSVSLYLTNWIYTKKLNLD